MNEQAKQEMLKKIEECRGTGRESAEERKDQKYNQEMNKGHAQGWQDACDLMTAMLGFDPRAKKEETE
ncbi:hypothetical protein [Aureibacillus halotolerans]|uniref:Uncharacterized protein n=1 Tax=Aureibacillus halotolerans TaxID=1508390 RepID=A0A4R6U3W0_9BACI|nr:hypothetical protein [Aureibacillus halotolerans]TDQ39199.1 hypothetical protein EV213_108151 [Aureibacillus halotolerans]